MRSRSGGYRTYVLYWPHIRKLTKKARPFHLMIENLTKYIVESDTAFEVVTEMVKWVRQRLREAETARRHTRERKLLIKAIAVNSPRVNN